MKELVEKALQAKENSYSPYSNFRVGAVLVTKEGELYTGCNIENTSFGLTCCAERVALFKAVSEGKREFSSIFIASDSKEYIAPCGACRQALAEFNLEIKIYMVNAKGDYLEKSLLELFPFAFDLKMMTKEEDK